MARSARGRRLQALRYRRPKPPGTPPGTVVADPAAQQTRITVTCYGPDRVIEQPIDHVSQLGPLLGQQRVTWIDVEGLSDTRVIEELGRLFGLHPLAMEDVVSTHQRAKVEDYGQHLFLVGRMVVPDTRFVTEQLSVFLGPGFVLTFQERPPDQFLPIHDAIRRGKGRVRQMGADYLAYLILDMVVDGYFPVLEGYGEHLEQLDARVAEQAANQALGEIHDMRSDLLLVRRAVWPLRDAISTLIRENHALLTAETRLSLRDCYDHAIQIIDLVETARDLCADLREFYQSAVNTRMNEIMTVLTLITSIFIPISFVAGVYGMNFNPEASRWNMPELNWDWGYPAALLVMTLMTVVQLVLFWRRGWLRTLRQPRRKRLSDNNGPVQ